jgi:hypothetical protein
MLLEPCKGEYYLVGNAFCFESTFILIIHDYYHQSTKMGGEKGTHNNQLKMGMNKGSW